MIKSVEVHAIRHAMAGYFAASDALDTAVQLVYGLSPHEEFVALHPLRVNLDHMRDRFERSIMTVAWQIYRQHARTPLLIEFKSQL